VILDSVKFIGPADSRLLAPDFRKGFGSVRRTKIMDLEVFVQVRELVLVARLSFKTHPSRMSAPSYARRASDRAVWPAPSSSAQQPWARIRKCRWRAHVTFTSILDDCPSVGTAVQLRKVAEVQERENAPLGLALIRDKTRMLWLRTSAAPVDTAHVGFPVATGSMVVLGIRHVKAQQRRDIWQDQRNAARAPQLLSQPSSIPSDVVAPGESLRTAPGQLLEQHYGTQSANPTTGSVR